MRSGTSPNSPDSSEESFDIFLSHDWGDDGKGRNNHHRARTLKDALATKGIKVWFDEVNMDHRNIAQAMSSGIEKSKVGAMLSLKALCVSLHALKK